ncbi:MAG: ATP-binding protein [Candidatus Aenigmarchaeota archaeon]|nr:ATP-binding protein [Candidatus Aenigmarchaeota archaeon]
MVLARDTNCIVQELGHPKRGYSKQLWNSEQPVILDQHDVVDHYTRPQYFDDISKRATDFVLETMRDLGYSRETIRAAYRVIGEAVLNSYEHAHRCNPRVPISLTTAIFEDGSMVFQVKDNGDGFDLNKALKELDMKNQINLIESLKNYEQDVTMSLASIGGYLAQLGVKETLRHRKDTARLSEFSAGGRGMDYFIQIEKENGFEVTYDDGGTLFNLLIRRNPFCRLPERRELENVA